MISISQPKFLKTFKYLRKAKKLDPIDILHKYGRQGVSKLSAATPKESGETAFSWSYTVTGNKQRYELAWSNSVVAGSVPLVILLQYGHATKSGYYLSGRDFINPALQPVYDAIERELLNEVFG